MSIEEGGTNKQLEICPKLPHYPTQKSFEKPWLRSLNLNFQGKLETE